jgi:hypothetical protein
MVIGILARLSIIFQLHISLGSVLLVPQYPEKTTDLQQVNAKLYLYLQSGY